jgi:glycosyl transferase family 25
MNHLDAIIYINLEHRLDRKKSIINEMQKVGCPNEKIFRINAVLNKQCGHIGCAQSHIMALELAINNNWDQVLILEDDFLFAQDKLFVNQQINSILDLKWDVIMLSMGHRKVSDSEYPQLWNVQRASTTAGYLIRKHYYETLLLNFKESLTTMEKQLSEHIKKYTIMKKPPPKLNYCCAIDQHWGLLQKKDLFYCFKPEMGKQSNSISDNNCSIDYQEQIIKMSEEDLSNLSIRDRNRMSGIRTLNRNQTINAMSINISKYFDNMKNPNK